MHLDSPTVTTSGSLGPKLFLRRFIEALAVASDVAFGESGHEGGVCDHEGNVGPVNQQQSRPKQHVLTAPSLLRPVRHGGGV